jgi:ABC-type nitrate/sulfonate/bicarbonate transport system substrate-binding protein
MVPDPDNLQFMSFWVAVGAGLFKEEGLDVQIVTPPSPQGAPQLLLQGRAEVAVLPPPMYLPLIGQQQPIVIFANLLVNDQINLIVRKDVLEARKLSPNAPLAERLQGIKGLKVGIASGPPTRLRALFASVGLDVDRDIQMIIVPPLEQNQAFGENRVDALYAHTPFLERALVQQNAVILVNQSRGEVPQLTGRQIHSLVTTRSFVSSKPEVLAALTRAILRAQRLVHADQKAAVDAVLQAGIPGLDRRLVETIVSIYEPAIPQTPEVSIEGIEIANKLFPESHPPPDLSKVNLADYIAPQFAQQAVAGGGY